MRDRRREREGDARPAQAAYCNQHLPARVPLRHSLDPRAAAAAQLLSVAATVRLLRYYEYSNRDRIFNKFRVSCI